MRNYDDERLAAHFGVPGMNRPNALRFRMKKPKMSPDKSEIKEETIEHEDKNQNEKIEKKPYEVHEYDNITIVIEHDGDQAKMTIFDLKKVNKKEVDDYIKSLQKEER
ncbi:MAG: hypothetical protein J6U54_05620 [Clostridiales bacterium]|nr:hypothetical protein [Clostridiales bacterium]